MQEPINDGRKFISAEAFHPGEYVSEEMEARGWSIETMCERSGVRRDRMESIIACKWTLTLLDAHCLGNAFGTGPEVWRNLQTAYDRAIAAGRSKSTEAGER